MEAFRKAVHSPFMRSSKHQKMSDRWGDYKHRDKVKDGIVFHVKYLGSILVSELDEEGQSYGDSISAEAIKTIVAMSKSRKLPMTSLTVSPFGLRVVNMETQDVMSDLDIYRICFCTADRSHEKVFAYIARNRENETMECHAFLCDKRKIAEAVTLTVAESFQIAKDLLENNSNADIGRLRPQESESVSGNGDHAAVHTSPPLSPGAGLSPTQPVAGHANAPLPDHHGALSSDSRDLMSFAPCDSISPKTQLLL